MLFCTNRFAELAARARSGDLEAQQQFRQELENAMVVMVRQALHDGKDTTSIARRILAVARRRSDADGGARMDDTEEFVREVAHEVCDEVMARLRPCSNDWSPGDSVHHAGFQATVLAS